MGMDLRGYVRGEPIYSSPNSLIFRGIRKTDRTPVVIKTINREYPTAEEIARFRYEYTLTGKLDSPGVIRVFDYIRYRNQYAIILEDYGAVDMLTALPGPVELGLFFELAIKITSILGDIHHRNVIHKDINPANILYNEATREIKIIDFGISTELSRERQEVNITDILEGSLAYISPEQTGRMNRDLDYRTDFYSLGVTFYQLLTGELPFRGNETLDWLYCHITKTPPDLTLRRPDIPVSLAEIVGKLLSKMAEDRYQSAYGLIRDLESCREKWRAGRGMERFPPGQFDVLGKFQLSQKLYGREEAIATLQESFEESITEDTAVMMVTGYSGVGKSALINETRKFLIGRYGNFISGKFDQLERDIPYSAIRIAFSELARLYLCESPERLERIRDRLLKALGPNGRIITDIIPDFRKIIGEQPPLYELDPNQARNRFNLTFENFVSAMVSREQPLALFLDDLQWADLASLDLLATLTGSSEISGLFLIGAYRDNEVDENHPLTLTLSRIGRSTGIRYIALTPLDPDHINQLVADTLHRDKASCEELSNLINSKTGGNPFFAREFLIDLYRKELINFSMNEGRWTWNIDQITEVEVSNNVVEYLIGRLRDLPGQTVEMLRVAACIGNRFDLKTLSLVSKVSASSAANNLWKALEQEIVEPVSGRYRLAQSQSKEGVYDFDTHYKFRHDRVHQAAYESFDEISKRRTHLAVGRLIFADDESDKNIVEVTRHFNVADDLVDSADERERVAGMNLRSGKKAKMSAAYGTSLEFFKAGMHFLGEEPWVHQYKLTLDLHCEGAESAYLSGDFKLMERWIWEAESHAQTVLDRARISTKKINGLHAQQRPEDAAREALATFRLLGLKSPKRPGNFHGVFEFLKTRLMIGRKTYEDFVNLREMTDPRVNAIMQIMYASSGSVFQYSPSLLPILLLRGLQLSIKYGVAVDTPSLFAAYGGIVLCGLLGDVEQGYKFGRIALAYSQRPFSRKRQAAAEFYTELFISPHRKPLRKVLSRFQEIYRLSLETGDLECAALAIQAEFEYSFFAGRSLKVLAKNALEADKTIRQLEQRRIVNEHVIIGQVALNLYEDSETPWTVKGRLCDEISLLSELHEAKDKDMIFVFYSQKTALSYLFNRDAEAFEHARLAKRYLAKEKGTYATFYFYFYQSLSLLRELDKQPAAERTSALKQVSSNLKKMKKRAKLAPENYRHKCLLIEAELARVRTGLLENVLALFKEAIRLAGEHEFIHEEALAHELTALFLLEKGFVDFARFHLKEAIYLYNRWGAAAKVNQLKKHHAATLRIEQQPDIPMDETIRVYREPTPSRTSLGPTKQLDESSVIKAAQAISVEVELERLLKTFLSIVRKTAGAEKAILALNSESGELLVEAESIDDVHTVVGQSQPISENRMHCPGIIQFVAQGREHVVLSDASRSGNFTEEPYIKGTNPKSILCLPIINQGRFVGILYLENNAVTNVFTSERVNVLTTLAITAAISIENAQLYRNLEQKVDERTAQLRQKTRDIQNMLQNMKQGILTILPGKTIHHEYSIYLEKILETGTIAGTNAADLLFSGSNLSPDDLDMLNTVLECCIGEDSVNFTLNENALVKECIKRFPDGREKTLELEWNPIVGDGDVIEKLMVIVRDVTELRILRAESFAQKRELEIVGQILAVPADRFNRFLVSSKELIEKCSELTKKGPPENPVINREILRHLHTLKGNARIFRLGYIIDNAHDAETEFESQPMGNDINGSRDQSPSLIALERLRETMEEYAAVFHHTLRRTQDTMVETEPRPESLRSLIEEIVESLPSLAEGLGKPTPDVEVTGDHLFFTPAIIPTLKNVLNNCFRNSIDHGLETSEERREAGKQGDGNIRLDIDAEDTLTVRFQDDGRGIDLPALRKVGEMRGILPENGDLSDEELVKLIFEPGISTAKSITRISGRGIGLDAAKAFLQEKGGDIHVKFTAPALENGCRPFRFEIHLPENYIIRSSGL